MSVPVQGPYGCDCTCTTPGLNFIPIDGAFFGTGYRMSLMCGAILEIGFYNGGLGNVWTGHSGYDEDGVTLLPVTVPCVSGDLEVDATLTVTSRAPGGVEVKLMDGATVVARWISIAAFQPHCRLAMKLVEYDKSCFGCEMLWDEYPCLQTPQGHGGCLCDGSEWAYRVKWDVSVPDATGMYQDLYDLYISWGLDSTTADIYANQYVAAVSSIGQIVSSFDFVLTEPVIGGPCAWQQILLVDDDWYTNPITGLPVPLYLRVVVSGMTGGLSVAVYSATTLAVSLIAYAEFVTTDPVVPCCSLGMPTYCTEGPWSGSITSGYLHGAGSSGSVTVTPVRLPDGRPGYVDPNCFITLTRECQGASLWRLKKTVSSPGNGVWAWELVSSSCEFWCGTASQWCKAMCPTTPVIPEGEISDEDAATAGLVDEAEHIGTCGCGADCNGNNPNPVNCLGVGQWYLRRILCELVGPDVYLYYWEMEENGCSGVCGEPSECTPNVPFDLPETPITDTEAEGLGLLELLDTIVLSDCSCNDNAYVPPNCPEVCAGTCDYVIAGYTSACGSYGTMAGTLVIDITSDGTSGGTHIGYVYLNVSANNCTSCSCVSGTRYSTSLAYWGVGGFPCNSALVGSPGATIDCE